VSVGWREDEEFGRFHLSKKFDHSTLNKWMMSDGQKVPRNPNRGILCVDAFRVEKTDSDRMSDGAIAGFWKHDILLDPLDKPTKDWESNRFILSYRYRTDTTEELSEDTLMAAIYLGFLVYPENNVDVVIRDFKKWGFDGFLLYDTDSETGEFKNNPGFFTNDWAKISIFNALRDHVKNHGSRERHVDILTECLSIPNRDKMKDYDLFTAAGGCLLGVQSLQGLYMDISQQETHHDTSDWINLYDYGRY
jgi:hypothetical protein